MNLLIDTCVFLWLIWDDPKLKPEVRDLISDGDNELYLSAINIWEACVKHRLGKLTLRTREEAWAHFTHQREAHEIAALAFDERCVRHLTRLPLLHNDPFDRLLICQAIEHSLTLVTPDSHIRQYPIRTMWY